MPDYKEMYFTLFRDVTKAIEILQKSQQQTEKMYLNSEEKLIYIEADTENKEYSKYV